MADEEGRKAKVQHWIVYTYETQNGALVCHAYGSCGNGGGPSGTGPFLEEDAQEFAKMVGVNGVTAMALPIEVGFEAGV